MVIFKNCSIELSGFQVEVGDKVSFGMKECTVRKRMGCQPLWCAISISTRCKMTRIANNKFVDFARCIEITSKRTSNSEGKLGRFKITDNVFANSSCKPVVERTDGVELPLVVESKRCTLRGNRCQPQKSFFSQVINMLHHVVEHEHENRSPLRSPESPSPDDAFVRAIMRMFQSRIRRQT